LRQRVGGTVRAQSLTSPSGTLECVNLAFGTDFNDTEPARAGQGTEFIRAYGEVLGLSATSYVSASGLEPLPHCKSSTGFVAWFTAEPPPQVSTEVANNINGTPTERLVISGPFGGTASRREPSSMPWLEEAEGTENTETHVKAFFVKLGVAANTEERVEVEREEAEAGVPTEVRSGCHHQASFKEVVREPGFESKRETELALNPAPRGCIKVTLVAPEVGVEVSFEGTLEPEEVNGAKNGLDPSKGTFGGKPSEFIGTETEIEQVPSERNGRMLMSVMGPAYPKSITAIKEMGYLRDELLTLK
jgi:hypothetical protein